ncbi:MAG: DUF2232 domain-containing protein [Candidatus Zixiibacteriota bacterium]|nr:MAG: DUF2232 domain-containing protein [candidate division Zixibacteria bacterium]
MRSAENRLSVLGGAVVAVSGLFWLAPAINSIAAFAGIVGLILIVTRLGYARGLSMASVGFILALGTSSLTTGYLEGLYYGSFYALIVVAPAFIMGWASRNLYKPISVVCYGLIPFGILFLLFAYSYIEWMRNLPSLINYSAANFDEVMNSVPVFFKEILLRFIESNYGAGEEGIMSFLKDSTEFLEATLKIAPGFLFITLLGTAVFSLAIAGYIATKMGVIIPRFQPFHHWKASGWWLLPTVLGLIPVVFRMQELWFYVGLNILIVTGHVYVVVGLAIVEAFFKRIILPVPIKVIFYVILILAGPISMTFLAILGLSDTKFNFKREIEDFENKE